MSTTLAPLWQIEDDLSALLESVAVCPEELQPELQQQIAAYMAQEVAKVDQVAHVLAMMEYSENAHDDEIARLQANRKAIAAAREKLERYVCRIIKARGVKALEGRTNRLSVRPSEAVEITDADKLPTEFQVATVKMLASEWFSLGAPFLELGVEADLAPAKLAIKKALKAGEEVPGADLVYRDNLQRK